MKILKIIKEELVPLSGRQQLVVLLLIAFIFQFVLFYAPVLADPTNLNTVSSRVNSTTSIIMGDTMTKNPFMDPDIAKQSRSIIPVDMANTPPIVNKTAILNSKPINRTKTGPKTKIKLAPHVKVMGISVHIITAYNSEVDQTDNTPCTTANGFNVCRHDQEDTIAVNFLKFGTKVRIPALFGNRIFIVRDRMNKENSDRVDIWMKNRRNAIKFGVKVAKIQVVQIVE